jgi:hypothetical protein
LSHTTSQAGLADGHQPQVPPFFPGEQPPGGAPALLAHGKRETPTTSQQRWRQQAAEDLPWIVELYATCADLIGRSSYNTLAAIFNRKCEVSECRVAVKAKTGGDCIRNPSDAGASYDAHKRHRRGHALSGTKETWVAPIDSPGRSSPPAEP